MKAVGTRATLVAALMLLALVASPAAFAQCSMCRAVVAQSPEAQQAAAELNRAIVLMFVAPYLIFGSCAAFLFRGHLGEMGRRLGRFLLLPR